MSKALPTGLHAHCPMCPDSGVARSQGSSQALSLPCGFRLQLLILQLNSPLPACYPPPLPPRRDGQRQLLPPVSNRRVVDFGAGVGRKGVYLYNLPEVSSGHQVRSHICVLFPSG